MSTASCGLVIVFEIPMHGCRAAPAPFYTKSGIADRAVPVGVLAAPLAIAGSSRSAIVVIEMTKLAIA